MFPNILTTICVRIFRIYKTFQLSDNMSNMLKLSDNLNELCMERIQFSLSIGQFSRTSFLCEK